MSIEKVIRVMEVTAYMDNKEPCCARDFNTGEVCKFYRTKQFGTFETCVVDTEERLERRATVGTLIPMKGCLVWGDEWRKQ